MLSRVFILSLLLITLVSSASAAEVEVSCSHKSVDVVFVVDGSSSIAVNDFNKYTKSFLQGFASKLSFDQQSQPTRISVVQFSNNERTRLVLPLAGDKIMVDRALNGLKRIGGGQTDTGRGLHLAFRQFEQAVDLDHKRVVILLTDGHNTEGESPVEVSKRLQEKFGAQVIAIGVGRGVNAKFLDSVASEPVSRNSFHVELLSKLESLVDPLVARVCAASSGVATLVAPAVQEEEKNTLDFDASAVVSSVDVPHVVLAEEPAIGKCTSCNCPSTYQPVCTKSGKHFSNECFAKCRGEEVTENKDCFQKVIQSCKKPKRPSTNVCTKKCAKVPVCQVCTASGKKYANECFATCRQEKIVPCKECKCSRDYAPVCTSTGKKYHNACFAKCANAVVVPCEKRKCDCPKKYTIQNLCGKSGRKYSSECHAKCRDDEIVPCQKCE